MAVAKYSLTGIDCPDPVALANFYSQLTGFEMEPLGEINPKDVKWFDLLRDGKAAISLAFPTVRICKFASTERTRG